ncbi:MAG: hypothetical protein HY832_02575 [Candidatus Aenigmarchaeota archaeon]|nr:hypothetical protein [Candidatus Aenigmarchaeota archaeon]
MKQENKKEADIPAEVSRETQNNNDFKIINVLFGLVVVLVAFVIVNQYMIFTISGNIIGKVGSISSGNMQLIGGTAQDAIRAVIPTGIPPIYGNELGIKYDDVSASNPQFADQTINKLGAYDNGITLTGSDLQRYIKITTQISCEYCCGAQAIVFSNGQAACGCAHSYAMRGLAKYLIKNHPTEFTDDQVLEELGKWKTLFFPGNIAQKALVLKEKGIELNYVNLASNKYRGIEKGQTSSGGGMVGGC